jgi:hypothetical protein
MTELRASQGRRGRKPVLDANTVLAALRSGETVRDIADRMSVDVSTVYRTKERALLAAFLNVPNSL